MVNEDWSFTTRNRGDGVRIKVPNLDGTTPCGRCPKIAEEDPKTPDHARELSDRNWDCYNHYLQCKAVGDFPDDPMVRRNAGIIRRIEDEHRDSCLKEPMERLISILCLTKKK